MRDLNRLAETVESLARRNKSSAGVTVPVPRVPEDEQVNTDNQPTTRSQMRAAAQAPRMAEASASGNDARPFTSSISHVIERVHGQLPQPAAAAIHRLHQ